MILRLQKFVRRLKGDISLTAATGLGPVVAFISSLIGAKYVAPEELGILQSLMLITTYLGFLHFGVFNGLNREIAFFIGKNDQAKVQALVNGSWRVAKALAMLGIVITSAFIGYFFYASYPSVYLWTMIVVGCWLCTDPFYAHMESVYRSSRHFGQLATALMWQNMVGLITSLLPIFGGIYGLLGSRAIQGLTRITLRFAHMPYKATGPGDRKDIVHLSKVGFPILVAGVLFSYVGVSDRSVVALMLTSRDVGYLALSGLVISALQVLPVSLANLFYPRLASLYGKTGNASSLRRYCWIGLGMGAAILAPVCLLSYFFIPIITQNYLSKYVRGIPAAQIASLGCLTYVSFVLTGVISTLQRMKPYITAILISMALAWGLGFISITHGYGIEGAIVSKVIALSFLSVFTIAYAFHLTRDMSVE